MVRLKNLKIKYEYDAYITISFNLGNGNLLLKDKTLKNTIL